MRVLTPILLLTAATYTSAFPSYVNCLGRFTKGFCNTNLLWQCPDNVMGGPIVEPLQVTATPSATTVTQGQNVVFTFSANQVRVAWAERGSFVGDSVCTGFTETKLAQSPGLGLSVTWTAPTNFAGDVRVTFAANGGGNAPITRQTFLITVEPPSGTPTNEPTIATAAPTSGQQVFAELLNFGTAAETATIGDTILVLANSVDGLYLNSFVPGFGQGGAVTPATPCETTGGNLLTGVTSTGDSFYNGILGEDNFDTAVPTDVGSATQFDDLLGGRGGGVYQFVKQDCSVSAVGNCCDAGNPAQQSRLTLTVNQPTTSPTLAPTTSQPTSSPTGPFVLPVIDWVLPYVGPSVVEARVGDRLSFDLIDFSHNIIEIPTKADFDNCVFDNAVIVRDGLLLDVVPTEPEDITFGLQDIGTTRWFTCNRTTGANPLNHCLRGQKLTVKIREQGTPEQLLWNLAEDYSAGLDLEPASTIEFTYTPPAHSVFKFPTKADFDNCNLSAAVKQDENEFSTGNSIRIGDTVGSVEWYGCGVGTHCDQGQKIAVRIVADAGGDVDGPEDPFELNLLQILTVGTVGGGAVAGLVVVGLRRRSGYIVDDKYSSGLHHIGVAETRESLQMAEKGVKETSFHESMEPTIPYAMSTSNPRRQIDSSDLKF